MNVKPIDLLRVAELNQSDYDALWQAADLLVASVLELEFPPELHAKAWRLMRECGAANVGNFDTMRMVASRLNRNRTAVGRLRAYPA